MSRTVRDTSILTPDPEKRETPVLIDFGDGVERECSIVGFGPDGGWTIRSPEGALGYYSGPYKLMAEMPNSRNP